MVGRVSRDRSFRIFQENGARKRKGQQRKECHAQSHQQQKAQFALYMDAFLRGFKKAGGAEFFALSRLRFEAMQPPGQGDAKQAE